MMMDGDDDDDSGGDNNNDSVADNNDDKNHPVVHPNMFFCSLSMTSTQSNYVLLLNW